MGKQEVVGEQEVLMPAGECKENLYKVPHKQWSRWGVRQRRIFNRVYTMMRLTPSFYMHPEADPVPTEHWETTAWNAAWEAASACR